MSKAITRPKLRETIVDAAADAILTASKGEAVSPAQALAKARTVANDVVGDNRIAAALEPISRLKSETMQGLFAAGAAQLLDFAGVTKSLVIAGGWFGYNWNPDEVSTVMTTVVTLAGLAWAWYGRETTTRPLA